MEVSANKIGYMTKLSCVSMQKNIRPQKQISFGDTFNPNPEVIFGELSSDEAKEIINTITNAKELSSGFTSAVYKIKDKIVKAPKDKTFSDSYQELLAKGQNLKEYFALSRIKDIDSTIATNPAGIIRNKDSYCLVEEFVNGSHPKGCSLSAEHLKDLCSKFFKLDKHGIFNSDLQPGNIFLTDEAKTKLIDFGSFNFILNNGQIIGSDMIPPDSFKQDGNILKNTTLESSKRFLKTFLTQNNGDIKNLADNPYMNIPSNASNFELRTMYSHLLDGSEKNPLEFFKGYLKTKSESYHSEMKKFLETLNFNDIEIPQIEKQKVDAAKDNLKKAIEYEGLIKDTLANATDDVAKAELAKLQLRTFLNLGDSLNSPVENSKKLKDAYNQLVSVLEDGIQNSDGTKKEYFTQTLNDFRNKFNNYPFEQGQVAIPENENLLKALYKKTNNINPNTTPNTNLKKIALIAAGVVALTGAAILVIKKIKNNKAKNIAPAIQNIAQPKSTPATATTPQNKTFSTVSSAKTPDIFSQFQNDYNR